MFTYEFCMEFWGGMKSDLNSMESIWKFHSMNSFHMDSMDSIWTPLWKQYGIHQPFHGIHQPFHGIHLNPPPIPWIPYGLTWGGLSTALEGQTRTEHYFDRILRIKPEGFHKKRRCFRPGQPSSTPTHPISKDQCLQLQAPPFESISIQAEEEKEGCEREGC